MWRWWCCCKNNESFVDVSQTPQFQSVLTQTQLTVQYLQQKQKSRQ